MKEKPKKRPLVSVERQFETDIATGKTETRMFVKLYFEARDSGLLADIGDRRWRTLCALATYMDENGSCCPSQSRIAGDLGIHRQRVNERIRELLDYQFQGRPVISVAKTRRLTKYGGRWASNEYTVHPISGLRIFGDPVSGKSDTGKVPMSGKPDTGNPDTNKSQSSNKNTPRVSSPKEREEAAKLVAFFRALRGHSEKRAPASKEIEHARGLISDYSLERAKAVVKEANALAEESGFEQVQWLGGIMGFVPDAEANLRRRDQARAQAFVPICAECRQELGDSPCQAHPAAGRIYRQKV